MKIHAVGNWSRLAHAVGRSFKAHSPEICLVGGIALMVTGAVMAVAKSGKNQDVLLEHTEVLNTIDDDFANEDSTLPVKGDENYKAYRHEVVMCYKDTGLSYLKLYAVPMVCEIGGIALILASYGIMRKRNALLLGAYSALEAYHKEVMQRVNEVCDEDTKLYIRDGVRKEKIDVTEVDAKGKSKTHKEEVSVAPDVLNSPYSRFYGGGYGNSDGDPESDKFYLVSQQNQFNDRLRSRGVVFLNEVYEALGFPPTSIGAVTGWRYNGDGDNFISFGIGDVFDERGHMPATTFSEAAVRWMNGYEQVILLDFNVDGVIYDKI